MVPASVLLALVGLGLPTSVVSTGTRLEEQLTTRQPFLDSDEARTETDTLHRYFQDADYRRLRGNPILGYWDAAGFIWRGLEVTWLGIRTAPGCGGISPAAFDAAFRYVAKRRGLKVLPGAPIRLAGKCVWAVVDGTEAEPVPGVLLEVRVESATGVLRYRFGMGKPAVEDAVGAAVDFILGFAMAVRE
jgi:hypothetical protein